MKFKFRESFGRDLKKITDSRLQKRIQSMLEVVEAADAPSSIRHIEKIAGHSNAFRIRVGDHRIGVYIEGEEIEFVRCLPRRDIYRLFP